MSRGFVELILIQTILFALWHLNLANKQKDYLTFMSNKLELLSHNEKVILNLMDFEDQLQDRIDGVKKLADYLRQPVQAAKGREKEYLSNPLNVYSLLRQSESDWTQVLRFMEQPIGQEQVNFMSEMHKERPSLKSVRDSMTAIHRIKEVYKLNASDLARGIIERVQHNAKLSVLDCYEMGYLYYNASQFEIAAEWLLTARELLYRPGGDINPALGVTSSDICSLLARTYTALGKYTVAHEVLLEDPEFSGAAEAWLEFFKANLPEKVENEHLKELKEKYYRLCRWGYQPQPTRLVCFYKTQPTPFLLLAPFKAEELSLDPYVVAFHDVVYSSEAAVLERASEPLMERAVVSTPTKTFYESTVRTVQSVWLPDNRISMMVNELVHRIQQRIRDLSDLQIKEKIQLLNYGVGGHFQIHHDTLNFDSAVYDDRFATVLLYLNDVVSGGATVFPWLNLAVKPERGKVIQWPNLKSDSYDVEKLTCHAACPVIIGNKLAMSQWIHEAEEMFEKPCLVAPKERKVK